MSDLISRQAVLETLDDMDNALDEDRTVENYKELLTECYEVLPPVTPQTKKRTEERTKTHACDCISRETHVCDCISRQAAIDALSHMMDTDGFRDGWAVSRANVDCMLRYLPSVEPERKQGHWEWDQRTGEYVCSECGCNPIYERTTPDVNEIDKYRFCRWCGAPMEVETDHS